MKPTPQQQRVIDTRAGKRIVIACPGSGKTATLVARCRALPAHETKLVLAFNKKAADEFAFRLGTVSGCDVRTFHSFCFREVMGNYQGYGFQSRPTKAEGGIFQMMCKANNVFAYGWDQTGWLEDFVNRAEHEIHTVELKDYASQNESFLIRNTAKALLKYREFLYEKCLFTFDSMVRLVAERPHLLTLSGQHVMIDEYQDVDSFQFQIAGALAMIPGTLSFVVVGDPNQRIYGWRGALEDAFMSMQAAFPDIESLPLTTNFRSYEPILRLAEGVCSVGMSGVRGEGSGKIVEYFDPGSVGVDVLIGEKREGLQNYAILCRYNRDCARWQISLARQGIPVFTIGGGDFWRLKHVKIARSIWEKEPEATFATVINGFQWKKMIEKGRYEEEQIVEMEEDARFIMGLSDEDMEIFEKTLQREDIGLRIATIHKTKGLEFDEVLVSGVTEKLKKDTFVYYVGVTRARNRLVLA